ncbi:NmrA family NAD(P)-binding protein [Nocardia salmonicida]|uniref:NmrA family NAD(P)-binding protein n=1 Tax=Nocardia salmonicida TaxID=53431 RepID=UPI00344A5A1D
MKAKALIVGASGYNAMNLARRLASGGHMVRGLVRDRARAVPGLDDVVTGDLVTGAGLGRALDNIDVAFYFVHALDAADSTDELDVRAAHEFVRAATAAKLPRGVFFTMLAPPPGTESPRYQRNRLHVEQILMDGLPGMSAVRAGMVLGPGSRGPLPYLRLVQRSPILPLGPWRTNRIAVVDAATATECTYRAGTREDFAGRSVDAPASAQPTHEEFVRGLIEILGLGRRRMIIPTPFADDRLDARLIATLTGQSYNFCRYLLSGNRLDYLIDPDRAALFHDLSPASLHEGLQAVATAPPASFRNISSFQRTSLPAPIQDH